ncbi:MAG: outer membrane protein assembly factor BamB [Arenimonas sp.]|nr:outer membrane protein assembly factor BamB [Arenimonas sp.]MBP6310004.1 outer membrane protein assembly factor BamB [Arenimonas sp.]
MAIKNVVIASALIALAGCSSISNVFKTDKEKVEGPSPLVELAKPIAIKKLWSVSIGQGEGELGLRQKPFIDGDTIFAADSANELVAIEKATGKIKWQINANKDPNVGGWKFWENKTPTFALTGGPSVYSGLLAIGSRNGEVMAFNALDGSLLWKKMVSSSVVAAPLVTSDTVVVRVNDGKVFGLDFATGEKKWQFDRGIPSLTVRGNSSPVLGPGFIFVGYEDGTLIALNQNDGTRVWEQLVAKPDGRSEIERMSDIDGEIQVGDQEVFVNSYHNSTMAINLANGQPIWVREIGGYAGIALMSDRVILTDKAGNVWALDRLTGSDLWKQSGLTKRGLTTPVIQGSFVVVSDQEGYTHWLDSSTGDIKGRVQNSDAVVGTPVVSDDGILFVQSVDGKVSAFGLAQ